MKQIILTSIIALVAFCITGCSNSKDETVQVKSEQVKSQPIAKTSECIFYNTEKKYTLEVKNTVTDKDTAITVVYDDINNNHLDPIRKLFYDSNGDGNVDSVFVSYYEWPNISGPNMRARCVSSETLKSSKETQSDYTSFIIIKDLLNNLVKEYQQGNHRDENDESFVDVFEDGYAVNSHNYLWIVKYIQNGNSVSGVDIVNPR